jgi:hypothetical protein
MSACLPDAFEGRGLLGWFRRQIVEFLQERGRGREEPPAMFLGLSEPSVELSYGHGQLAPRADT